MTSSDAVLKSRPSDRPTPCELFELARMIIEFAGTGPDKAAVKAGLYPLWVLEKATAMLREAKDGNGGR